MEGQSPNINANAPLSSTESRQLSSNVPMSFREMSGSSDNSYNDINLNVPNGIGSNPTTRIGDGSFSTDVQGDCGQKRKAHDGSSVDNGASTSTDHDTRDRQLQVTDVHDISSRSVHSSGPSLSQGQASPRENTSMPGNSYLVFNPPGYSPRDGHSRRRQRYVTRSLTASHDTTVVTRNTLIPILDTSAATLGGGGLTLTNLGRFSNTTTFLQRLRPTSRRREMITQALRYDVPLPMHVENTPVEPVVNVPLPASSTSEDHRGLGSPPPQQQSFSIYRSEGINLAVVSNFDGLHEDRPQDNLMLTLSGISDADIIRLQNQIRINTPLSEEAILQGLITRTYQTNAEEEQEICCICFDELGNGQDLVKLDCGHCYHFECIKRWLAEKNCCPVCKRFALPT